jgi:membrane-bound metal-dependent hydrolase YbcI (DUF457 family)
MYAGVGFYGVFLGGAFTAFYLRDRLPLDVSPYLLPVHPNLGVFAALTAVCCFIAFVGSMFPDTDIKSISQKVIYRGLLFIDIILVAAHYYTHEMVWMKAAALLGLAAMLPLVDRHRGWTHSRAALLVVWSPLLVVPMVLQDAIVWVGAPYYLAGVIGNASHLFADGRLFRFRKSRRRGAARRR